LSKLEQVDYDILDKAKNAFIEASKKTLGFASKYGFVPDGTLGASANLFSLNLKPYLETGSDRIFITLLPEGLGTADDARPTDLTNSESELFWHNIAIKTVSALTNDAASGGMQTILISLYLPSSCPERVFNQSFLQGFLNGFVSACKTVGCVWLSGETPQLKGKIYDDKLDIAGALFGILPPSVAPVDGSRLAPGDKIVFVGSSGPHENGFTTLRKIAADLPNGYRTKLPDGQEFWQAINAPSVLYTPFVQDLLTSGIKLSSIENITGHGWQKLMRSKKHLRYTISEMLPVPSIFRFVEETTKTTTAEMLKIFNYGVGLAIFVDSKEAADQLVTTSKRHGLNALIAGQVTESDRREVVVEPLGLRFSDESFTLKKG
jgi:phosphoribosylformylglycinamidine cyclo-ligase